VRADLKRAGLLYAGTETGVFVSFDDGDHWQSLQRQLPTTWVRDLILHGDDLIAGTQGRAIWVMDDISPLRQFDAVAAGATAQLFQPATAIRLRKNQNRDTPLPREEPVGRNPPAGAAIDYWLASAAGRVELEIRDAAGTLVRHYSSDAAETPARAERYFSADWITPPQALSNAAGMHRFYWDLHYPRPRATEYEYSLSTAFGAGVPVMPEGPLAVPGDYRVVLRVDGREQSVPLAVAMDPRVPADAKALSEALAVSREAQALLDRHYAGAAEYEFVADRTEELRGAQGANAKILAALDAFDARMKLLHGDAGDRPGNTNLANIGEILRKIETDVEFTDRAPTEPQRRALAETGQRLERALALWQEIRATDLARLNARLNAAGAASIVIPPLDAIRLNGPSVSREVP